jgi:hypothetical protein
MGGPTDSLIVYDLQEMRVKRLLKTERDQANIQSIVWSPGNEAIAFACCFAVPATQTPGQYLAGRIESIKLETQQMEAWGNVDLAFEAGTPPVCWTAEGKVATGRGLSCSGRATRKAATSFDGQRTATLSPQGNGGWLGPIELTVRDASSGQVLWQREMKEAAMQWLAWSADGQYLLLDDDQVHSPIWRMRADGQGGPEQLMADGFLIDVVPQW